jgi:hypothetical protein
MKDGHFRLAQVIFLAQSAVVFHLTGGREQAGRALAIAAKLKSTIEVETHDIGHELREARSLLSV